LWIYNIPHTYTNTRYAYIQIYKSIIIDTPHIYIIIYTYAYKYRVET